MLITLKEKDRSAILDYASGDPEMNLFLIGDIENYGVSSPSVNVYAHQTKGDWDFLLLRFYNSYVFCSQNEACRIEPALEFLNGRSIDLLGGNDIFIRRFEPSFATMKKKTTHLSRCDRLTSLDTPNPDIKIRQLGVQDVSEQIDLLSQIKEFGRTYAANPSKKASEMAEEFRNGSSSAFGAFIDGRLVSLARTSAENSQSAMIVGVATYPDNRGKGIATAVVSALCHHMFVSGKKYLCLFYDNPVAGRIYNRTGFKEIGLYGMLG